MPAAMQSPRLLFFFFNDTATTEIYTLSLHDALPICRACRPRRSGAADPAIALRADGLSRSEEHTSELQSRSDIVCRLLLEKKNLCPTLTDYRAIRYRLRFLQGRIGCC